MLPDVGARLHDQLLIFAVAHFAQALQQQPFGIALKKRIPIRSP